MLVFVGAVSAYVVSKNDQNWPGLDKSLTDQALSPAQPRLASCGLFVQHLRMNRRTATTVCLLGFLAPFTLAVRNPGPLSPRRPNSV